MTRGERRNKSKIPQKSWACVREWGVLWDPIDALRAEDIKGRRVPCTLEMEDMGVFGT